jgi:2-octaprenyl-6-methoxyphenol hydroxylase
LRDVAALAEHLIKALRVNEDIGAKSLLDAYLASRERDQRLVTRFSDSLAGLFYNRRLSKVILRNTAMLLVDIFPLFKRELAMRAMGISGRQPAMVSGAWE